MWRYRGTFEAEWLVVEPGKVPAHILPIRQEARE
jgi:hypothetical protein